MENPLVHASRERVRRPTTPRPSILPLSPAVQKLVRQGEVEAAGDRAHVEEIAPQMRAEEVAPVLIGGEVEQVGLIGGELEQVEEQVKIINITKACMFLLALEFCINYCYFAQNYLIKVWSWIILDNRKI